MWWGIVVVAMPPLACSSSGSDGGAPVMTGGATSEGTHGTDGTDGVSAGSESGDASSGTTGEMQPCAGVACSDLGTCTVVKGVAQCQCDVGYQPDELGCVNNDDPTPANYALDIIAPRPGLDLTNRFYKAYPGLEYNVRLAVAGGEFPFRFNLEGPAGMTIDARGVVDWPEPAAAGTPYPVTVSVTDANFNIASVTWDITVTTQGFRFIDAANGTAADVGGTGTLEDPWLSMKDMYEGDTEDARFANSYAGEFLYWREGTYVMDAYVQNPGGVAISPRKPLVWLAYPGESPVLDLAAGHLAIGGGDISNIYLEGLDFDVNGNERGMGMTIASKSNHVVLRNNRMHGITNGFVGGNNALVFLTNSGPGYDFAIQDNEMFDVNQGYGLLGYSARNVVLEGNLAHDIIGHALGPKMSTGMWFIRSNELRDNTGDSIGLQYYVGDEDYPSGDIEIAYNLVHSGGGRVQINSNHASLGLPVHIFRNTFVADVVTYTATLENGPFRFYNNVIVNEQGFVENIELSDMVDKSRVEVFDNLAGVAADSIVDAQGNLSPEYAASIGVLGHMLAQ